MSEPNGYIEGSNGERIEIVDTTARESLKTKLPAPKTAKAGDYLRISAINEDGSMLVEAVSAPGVALPTEATFAHITLETAQTADGECGVIIHPEGTEDVPELTFYGMKGDEAVRLNNVADAIDDRSVPNLGQVKNLVQKNGNDSGQNLTLTSPNGTVYMVAVEDDGTLYTVKQGEEPGEPEKPDTPEITYTVTNALTNAVTSNEAETVAQGAEYTALVTAADGYNLNSVVVTMGGVDITAQVYNGGVIVIPAVTGDIVVTVVATLPSEPTDIMSQFKYLGPTAYTPGNYTAWCPTGLIYDESRDVYAHFMNVQPTHWQAPCACELWFNSIDPDTLEHTEPVFIARTGEAVTGTMSSAGALGCCVKDGIYYMFSAASKGYYKSTDGGATWTHEQYEAGPDKNPWGCYVLDNGRMIMGSDTVNHKVYYSDDDGRNWTAVQSENFNEPTFVDFGGGVLMAICRRERDAENNIFAPYMHVSRDYGATWTASVEMTSVGLMGENNCNAYVHDGFVKLFVGCRYRTTSPQYTDTIYEVRQYVMALSDGPVDGFEYVNTVYRYKNDDNPQGLALDLKDATDFSTPCIAIKDKSHALLTFFAPVGKNVTHILVAVGNVPVDHFIVPKPMPSEFTASQTFNGDGTEITVCTATGALYPEAKTFISGFGYPQEDALGYPHIYTYGSNGAYLDVSDISDGGYLHLRTRSWTSADTTGWDVPVLTHVADGKVFSGNNDANMPRTPLPRGVATPANAGRGTCPWYPGDMSLFDIYAQYKAGAWWLFYEDTWVRNYFHDEGIPITGDAPTTPTYDNAYRIPYDAGKTTYKTVALPRVCRTLYMIEYDKEAAV